MAAELSQDAVLSFLRCRGGRVRNADLLGHFRRFLREGEEKKRARNRDLFKRFVNAVAVVQQQDGTALIVLKKRFAAAPGAVEAAEEHGQDAKRRGAIAKPEEGDRSREKGESQSGKCLSASPNADRKSRQVLLSVGIVNGTALAGERLRESSPHAPATTAVAVYTTSRPQHSDTRAERERGSAVSAAGVEAERLIEFGHRRTLSPERLPPVASTEHSVAGLGDRSPTGSLDCAVTPGETSRISYERDCEEAPNASVCSQVTGPGCEGPQRPEDAFRVISNENQVVGGAASLFSTPTPSQGQPTENGRSMATYLDCHRRGLSASHSDLAPSDRGTEQLVMEQWASDDALNLERLCVEPNFKVHEMLRRAQDSKVLALLHRHERKVTPWHHSAGNLDSSGVAEVAHAKPQTVDTVPLRSGASRTRSELRSRMCRSLGADLDQPFHEDLISARQNRLYLLSSSLSINYPLSTYSRAHRYKSTSGPEATSWSVSVNERSYSHRNVVVPLDLKEHDWLLKVASGSWTEVYALFREDHTLLEKRDFISGYTVLHWIAKHGDHRVLNTLWYGVSKAGMDLDVDVKTTCGYTPLHLAAIHGHKKMIRLLVHKFKANVFLRDTSGKRPWQYLVSGSSSDLLTLLGAPRIRAAGGKKTLCSENVLVQPSTMSPRVKRHTSLAAFLKHKPLLKVPPHSDEHEQPECDVVLLVGGWKLAYGDAAVEPVPWCPRKLCC
ncbi:ankyrin repeat domain-containing protein SOWAHB [Arapaima gigas]